MAFLNFNNGLGELRFPDQDTPSVTLHENVAERLEDAICVALYSTLTYRLTEMP